MTKETNTTPPATGTIVSPIEMPVTGRGHNKVKKYFFYFVYIIIIYIIIDFVARLIFGTTTTHYINLQ